MSRRKIEKVMALVLAGAMLSTNVTWNVLAQTNDKLVYAEQQEAFEISFVNEYAKPGEALIVNVTGGDNCTYQWYVDGIQIANDTNNYIPTVNDIEKLITVQVTAGSQKLEKSIYCSKLPVIYIETENQAPIVSKDQYVSGTMKIQGNDAFNTETTKLYDGAIEIKGRGNSTWGMPKKPYKVKLDKSTNIMDMGKSKHWVLLANYSDTSLMRNTLSYNLSGQLGMPQMDTTWVDVILNGKYIGNYQFCEQIKIDKNRVDIFDWEGLAEDAAEAISETEGIADGKALEDYMVENLSWITTKKVVFGGKTYQVDNYIEVPDITGGYLMELDEYYDEISKFKTDDGQPIMFKSPEFLNTNPVMMSYVKEYIQAFENAVKSQTYSADYKGEEKHYTELFDFDSLVDYWLINEIFFNEELNKKSTYLYKDIDGLVKMGPIWDMDYSSGGEGYTWITDQWATNYFKTNAQARNWYKSLIQDPYFILKAQERYWEIRDSFVEDMVRENGAIDSSYALLKESGDLNAKLWNYYKGHDFAKGTSVLRNWLNTHLGWLDTQFDTEDSVINSLGSYKTTNLGLTLTDADGKALQPDTISEKAKADVMADDGQDLNLQIQAAGAEKADIYVNSMLVEQVQLENGSADYKISAFYLSAEAGEKDIVEVKVCDSNNKRIGSDYISVYETMNAPVEEGYTVTVDGNVAAKGEYNTRVDVTAEKTDADGNPFIGWMRNDEIVSTDLTYVFYLSEDVDLKTCYDTEKTIKAAALLTNTFLTKRSDGKADVKFVGQLVIPEGYTLKEAGLVWSSKDTALIVDGGLNKDLKPTYVKRLSETNQFSVTIKGLPVDRFIRGSIFAILVSPDGKTETFVCSEEGKLQN